MNPIFIMMDYNTCSLCHKETDNFDFYNDVIVCHDCCTVSNPGNGI